MSSSAAIGRRRLLLVVLVNGRIGTRGAVCAGRETLGVYVFPKTERREVRNRIVSAIRVKVRQRKGVSSILRGGMALKFLVKARLKNGTLVKSYFFLYFGHVSKGNWVFSAGNRLCAWCRCREILFLDFFDLLLGQKNNPSPPKRERVEHTKNGLGLKAGGGGGKLIVFLVRGLVAGVARVVVGLVKRVCRVGGNVAGLGAVADASAVVGRSGGLDTA